MLPRIDQIDPKSRILTIIGPPEAITLIDSGD
jgi:hypothetical protein